MWNIYFTFSLQILHKENSFFCHFLIHRFTNIVYLLKLSAKYLYEDIPFTSSTSSVSLCSSVIVGEGLSFTYPFTGASSVFN